MIWVRPHERRPIQRRLAPALLNAWYRIVSDLFKSATEVLEESYSANCHRLCQDLLAIRKQQDWAGYASFEAYVTRRWGMSKTRAARLCDFAKFTNMAREARMRIPDAPDNLEPLLKLPQKLWLDAWRYCMDMDARSKFEIEATLDRFGLVRNKKKPPKVLDQMRVRRAGKALSDVVDMEHVQNPGPDWGDESLERAAMCWERRANR